MAMRDLVSMVVNPRGEVVFGFLSAVFYVVEDAGSCRASLHFPLVVVRWQIASICAPVT